MGIDVKSPSVPINASSQDVAHLLEESDAYEDPVISSTPVVQHYEGPLEESTSHHTLEASVRLPSLTMKSCNEAVKSFFESQGEKSILEQSVKSLEETLSSDQNSTLFMTIANLLPMLQGSAVFGVPFAILKGGLLVIPGFVLLSILADMTGSLLLDCLYEYSPKSGRRKRVRQDYAEVAEAALGPRGAQFISVVNFIYMFANNIVNVVLLGNCIHMLGGRRLHMSVKLTMATFSVVMFPTMFIRRLSVLSYVSMLGVFSVIIGTLASLVVFVHHATNWSANLHQVPIVDLENYPLGFAIYMYSIVTHPLLPNIEGCMTNSRQMNKALHISYSASTVLKILFGLFGVLTYGNLTKDLVALNVADMSFSAEVIVMVTLCMYALTTFGLMKFVICESLDKVCVNDRFPSLAVGGRYNLLWMIPSRLFLLAICVGAAYVVPYFGLVSGVTGALICLLLVYAFPVIFHLRLKWKELSNCRRFNEIGLLILGVVCGLLSIYASTKALIEKIIHS